MYFAYSAHCTREAAEDALEDYFASGIVCEGERPRIEKRHPRGPKGQIQPMRWCVMFPG